MTNWVESLGVSLNCSNPTGTTPCNNKHAVWHGKTDPGTSGCWHAVKHNYCIRANSWRYIQTRFPQSHTAIHLKTMYSVYMAKIFWSSITLSCQFLYVMLRADTTSNKKCPTEPLNCLSVENPICDRCLFFWGHRCSQGRAGQTYKISMLVLSRQMVRKSLSLTCNQLSDSQIQQQTDQITCHCTSNNKTS